MIPALIIWLCKKYIAPKINKRFSFPKNTVLKAFSFKILFLVFVSPALAQQQQQQNSVYNIKRNGEVIGQMFLQQREEGNLLFLKINSKVNTRILFKINVETEDVACFQNGKLLNSEVNRTVNGSIKEVKKTNWINESYRLKTGDKVSTIKQPIKYNIMLLYNKEPENIASIYSDNFQCFLPIIKNGDHKYRINLPDGNYNDYHFKDGICTLVVVNHSLYTIKMERV